MKKQTLLLIAVLALGLATWFFVVRGKAKSSMNKDEIAFAYADTASIHKIVLSHRHRNKERAPLVLTRKGTDWEINGQFVALKPRVKNLLETIGHISVREIVADAGLKSAYAALATNHTRVQLYDKTGTLLQDYSLGTEVNDLHGSIAKLENAERPYIIELPGLTGTVNGRYTDELDFWRENLLFNATLANLKAIKVAYTQAPTETFALMRTGDTWAGNGFKADTAKLNRWLGNFKGKIYAEQFSAKDFPTKQAELAKRAPDVVFTITATDGSTRTVVLYYMVDTRERYWGWVLEDGQLVTIQGFVLNKFLVSKGSLQ